MDFKQGDRPFLILDSIFYKVYPQTTSYFFYPFVLVNSLLAIRFNSKPIYKFTEIEIDQYFLALLRLLIPIYLCKFPSPTSIYFYFLDPYKTIYSSARVVGIVAPGASEHMTADCYTYSEAKHCFVVERKIGSGKT